jgi:hypothetical protein
MLGSERVWFGFGALSGVLAMASGALDSVARWLG